MGRVFFADQQSWDPAGRVCCAVRLAAGPIYWHPDPSHHLSGMRASERARVRRMRSQKQKWSLTTHRRPDALYIPRERTEAAAPSALKSHATSDTWCPITPKTGQLPAKRAGEYENPRASQKRGGYARRRRDLNPRGAMHPYLLSREAHSTGLCDVSSADYFRAFSPRARTCARSGARGRPARRRARDSNPRCHC